MLGFLNVWSNRHAADSHSILRFLWGWWCLPLLAGWWILPFVVLGAGAWGGVFWMLHQWLS